MITTQFAKYFGISIVLTGLAVSAMAQQTSKLASEADMLKARNDATGFAQNILKNQKNIDQNGRVTQGTGASSNPGAAPVNQQYFNNMMGTTSGAVRGGDPLRSSSGLGGTFTGEYTVRFNCPFDTTSKSAGGILFKGKSCKMQGNAPTNISFSYCAGALTGDSCTNMSEWTPVTIGNNNSTNLAGTPGQLGVTCDATSCSIRLTTSNTVSTGKDTMQQDAVAAATGSNSGSAYNLVAGTASNDDFRNQVREQGDSMFDCVSKNRQEMSSGGAVSTCDGQTVSGSIPGTNNAVPGSGQNGGTCTETKQCLQYGTNQVGYPTECTRQFSITSINCHWTIPTATCNVSRIKSSTPQTCNRVKRTVVVTTITKGPDGKETTSSSTAVTETGCESMEALK